VVAVHQHLGLDDRDDPGLLAQRRGAGERVSVDLDTAAARQVIADRDHGAPLREPRAELPVLREALAQAVEALGHLLLLSPARGLAPVSTLIPGMMPSLARASGTGEPSLASWRIVSS